MSDVYKLQYNGMTLAYPGWNGYVAFEDAAKVYTLTLNQQTGGTISADKMSGIAGEIVTLSNTPSAEYNFGSYSITGATLTGNQFAFGTSNVTAAGTFNQKSYTLTLQNDGHGTIAATKTTGYVGDTVTLSNTYNTYYRFNNYTVTGGTINGSTFTFGSQDATAQANFKVNSFTASGGWENGSNVSTAGYGAYSKNVGPLYATASYKTSNVPAEWYATSNRWKVTSTVSAYNITLNPKMTFTGKCNIVRTGMTAAATGVSLIGSTQTQSQNWSTNSTAKQTWNYNKSFTSNTTSVNYGISGKIAVNGSTASLVKPSAGYIAANTTGTWTATGYIP